ncbi:MAG: hypothetical protein ACJ78H_10685, partial [Chloroflexota bacterium]
MRRDPCSIGSARRNEDPDRHGARIPTTFPRDPTSKPSLSVDRPDEIVHVDDVGLELDHQQRSTPRMPRQDVDHSPFAVDRE